MAKQKSLLAQVHQYDKILQENIEAALPGLIKSILKINAVQTEKLPDSLQHTKERRPDVLQKITDDKGSIFVLHVEFQTRDDSNMAYRMAEYLIMLSRQYRIEVQQFVIYIGEGKSKMANSLNLNKSYFQYELIAISSIDYHVFLRSNKPEEKMFAILANFGNEDVKKVVSKIATQIAQTAKGDLEKERRKNQLRILAQLRTLVSENIEIMEQVSSFFKEENDIFYKVGEKRGLEKGLEKGLEEGEVNGEEKKSYQVVKNLISANRFTIPEIANFADVSETFVRKVKKSLNM